MTPPSLARKRPELTRFLLGHRRRLTPADVGLPPTGRRRTPGLRREEVAQLAGVGLTWYTWFEQGRDIGVSEAFLLGVSRALRLDNEECGHLFLLAHRRPPPPEAVHWPSVTPLVQQLMDDLPARPAYVINLRWDVVAWNAAAERLFGFSARAQAERNIMSLVFSDPALRARLPHWEQDASRLLWHFRCDLATAPDDAAMLGLIDELKRLSPPFRRWWQEAPPFDGYCRGISALHDADAGLLRYRHEMLIVDEYRHLRMIVYFADQDPA